MSPSVSISPSASPSVSPSPSPAYDAGLLDHQGNEKTAFAEFVNLLNTGTNSLEVIWTGEEDPSHIPERFIRDYLSANWNIWSGVLPLPTFIAANDQMGDSWRFDEKKSDVVVVRQTRTQDKRMSDDLEYKTSDATMSIELYTYTNRQRLYNMMSEVRRIMLYGRKRASIGEINYIPRVWYLLEYQNFTENTQITYNNWQGIIRVRLLIRGMRNP